LEDRTDQGTKRESPLDKSSGNSKPIEQVIIQVEKPGQKKLDMPSISKLLDDTGIKVDPSYGPFCVNPKLGHFVLRGFGTVDAQEKAKKNIPGLTVFRDKRIISPM
jgi:hypothetical protein